MLESRGPYLGLSQQLFDRTGLDAFEARIEIAVVFDRVSVGIEDGSIEISEGLVTFRAPVGQTDVTAAEVHWGIVPSHDQEWEFEAVGVVRFTG